MSSISAGKEADLRPGSMAKVASDGGDILVANTGSAIVAVADTCTHAGASLSEGGLDGDTITCGWHGAEFDCKTGCMKKFPAKISDLKKYEVSVKDGEIFVEA